MTRKTSVLFVLIFCNAYFARGDEVSKTETPEQLVAQTEFVFDMNAKKSQRVRPLREVLSAIVRDLKPPARDKKLQRTLIYGTTYAAPAAQREYSLWQQFIEATGATALVGGEIETLKPSAENGLRRGVVKVNLANALELGALLQQKNSPEIAVLDLGENSIDERRFHSPPDFQAWLQKRDLPLDFLDHTAKNWDELDASFTPETAQTKPALYYYSQLYARNVALFDPARNAADLKLVFPNAGILGRYTSTPFSGDALTIAAFQNRALTMPRVALSKADSFGDYYEFALARAGIRGRETDLDSKIYAQIPFVAGEKTVAWRKKFYGALAHGAKIFDVGDFRPANMEAPRELRRALDELSVFETIIQDGKLRAAQTALLISETGDIWNNSTSARRALFYAARASQIPLDFVTENELQKGDLKSYRVLLLADRNISRQSAKTIVTWVENGGTLLATAGAGMRDELNQNNILLFEQWGIRELEYQENGAAILAHEKAVSKGNIKWGLNTFPVFGARSHFDAGESEVLATFQDGAPAVASRRVDEGTIVYAGFWPQVESKMEGSVASKLMKFVSARVSRPVVCSVSDVESNVIESGEGIVIPLINWRNKPIRKLRVRLPFLAAFKTCHLASGGKVRTSREGFETIATFDLDAADALIFQ